MSDDLWSSQTVRDFLLGVSGGFAGAVSLPRITLLELFRHVTCGGITAIVLGPVLSDKLGTPSAATIWFTGVVGVAICQGAMIAVKRGFIGIAKRLRND
jgi:hypothetical protein